MDENLKKLNLVATAIDPIYIGTGGYTIGRVDNTIVRDPISNLPKIPGSSLAGTWRYYVALEAIRKIGETLKDKFTKLTEELKTAQVISENLDSNQKEIIFADLWSMGKSISAFLETQNRELFNKIKEFWEREISNPDQWEFFEENRYLKITCAGQDNLPQENLENAPFAQKNGKSGHCGHCLVCKGFGFSKKDLSWQGMLFFSDLEIVFFPVFTMEGTKWVTTEGIIERLAEKYDISVSDNTLSNSPVCIKCQENISEDERERHINLGWLYLPYKLETCQQVKEVLDKIEENSERRIPITLNDIVIVPDHLFSHIVNSNLEVRTSVSIDPLTGSAKEGALFTSEAIPRGTILHGEIRIFDKSKLGELESKIKPLPKAEKLESALKETKKYYETLGIGGMTTRGFGRMRIELQNGNSGGSRTDTPDGGGGE